MRTVIFDSEAWSVLVFKRTSLKKQFLGNADCLVCISLLNLLLILYSLLLVQNTAWFRKMDSVLYVHISWTIHGMWMIYITF